METVSATRSKANEMSSIRIHYATLLGRDPSHTSPKVGESNPEN